MPSSITKTQRINNFIHRLLPPEVHWLYDMLPYGVRRSHMHIQGSIGSGKTAFAALTALMDMSLGFPVVVIDPLGTLIDYILTLILNCFDFNKQDALDLLKRIILVDMSGSSQYVVETPIYYAHGGETLEQIAMRLIEVIERLYPNLRDAPLHGMPSIEYVGLHAGSLMYALDLGIVEIIDLLDNPGNYTHTLKQLASKVKANEIQESVAFFTGPYIDEWSKYSRDARTIAFRQQILHTHFSDNARAQYGGTKPGIDWKEVLEKRKVVLVDLSGETSDRKRRFAMTWILDNLSQLTVIRGRKGRQRPLSVFLDETSAIWYEDQHKRDLNDWLNVRSRNQGLMICGANQESFVLDPVIAKSWLVSPTTQILGSTRDHDTAVTIAKQLHRYDETMKQHEQNIYVMSGSETEASSKGKTSGSSTARAQGKSMPTKWNWNGVRSTITETDTYTDTGTENNSVNTTTSASNTKNHFEVIDKKPLFHPPEQQWELTVNELMGLKPLEFIAKVAQREGDGIGKIHRFSLEPYIAAMQPNDDTDMLRGILVEASGRPVKEILAEIEARKGIDLLDYKPPSSSTKNDATVSASRKGKEQSHEGIGDDYQW